MAAVAIAPATSRRELRANRSGRGAACGSTAARAEEWGRRDGSQQFFAGGREPSPTRAANPTLTYWTAGVQSSRTRRNRVDARAKT
jgi:hypothetical protein